MEEVCHQCGPEVSRSLIHPLKRSGCFPIRAGAEHLEKTAATLSEFIFLLHGQHVRFPFTLCSFSFSHRHQLKTSLHLTGTA